MNCIIQVRMSSKRLPGKTLKKINKLPVLKILLNNLKKSKRIKKIVVATSKNSEDKKIIKYCKINKINFYIGPLHNVFNRLLACAKYYKFKYFIRINGDSPLIDFKIINRAIKIHQKRKVDYDIVTNVFPRTFPKGQSVEIIRSSILQKNMKKFSIFDKEHVTTYFYKNHSDFKIKNFKSKKGSKEADQVVDYPRDLKIISKMLKNKL